MFGEYLHREINVRERLPRDAARILYVAAWLAAAIGVRMEIQLAQEHRIIGVDSHAYWSTLTGPLYASGPMSENAYLYSPVFAQALWPLAHLPWPIFAAIFSITDALVLVWLLKPLGWRWVPPLLLASSPEICSGNVFILLGASAALGFRTPGTWAFSALTKVTPTIGPAWWAFRREWRPLLTSVATIAVISIPSVIASPELWRRWITLLAEHASESAAPLGWAGAPALVYRLPVGLALVAWGARRNHRWTIPAAMVLAAPVLWFGTYTMLAAVPRMTDHPLRGKRANGWSTPYPSSRSAEDIDHISTLEDRP